MRPLLERLPHLHRLAVFDSVATAGSFTAAAKHLGISQPAVSRHMALLAKELDTELIERSGRSFVLTTQGQNLALAIDGAFTSLERTISEFDTLNNVIVLAVQPAMATSWVVPMLDQLESASMTEIRLRIFDRSSELDSSEWDIAIVPGTGEWTSWESTLLFAEAVRPLTAPSLAHDKGLDPDTTPAELVHQNLLHIDDTGRPNLTWKQWFSELGSPLDPPKPRLVYNAYPTVIQEALAGNGIALGWQHLLSDMVERGLLVPVGPIVQRQRGGHYMCWRKGDEGESHRAILAKLQSEIHKGSASFAERGTEST